MFVNLISALFSNDDGNNESVTPTYGHGIQEDDVDLQLRSLIYCYRRINVERLSPFYPVSSCAEDKHALGDGSVALDQVYNLDQFVAMLQEDAHRILVDWCKNKARLVCILSEPPVRSVSQLPQGFSYLILEAESSEDVYIQRLVHESNLYREHDISLSWKIECLKNIIRKQYSFVPARRKNFNKQDRWQIMIKYLSKLAEQVQIDRVYKAYRSQPPSTRRLSHSSDGSDPSTPTRSLKSKPSMTILRLDSSVRSRSSNQMNALSRNQPNSPALASRSPSPKKKMSHDQFASNGNSGSTSAANSSPLYQQSRNCVIQRLEREKKRLAMKTGQKVKPTVSSCQRL
ncbi:unnamed protein product [Kluyveromyces dobzhanskii CBS 2104]|uniref:WGS project CCBQ000000000 data, contig 00106 n=1 Tax=Kluyveromyces dobzhanskii CBS 2104 TaxID=1427455 RepID=A0A0A8L5U5_9SACH|nr:unnamed protein product [Kluyveromyces dobzhanskii CBS 2104]